jgi:hypothetical protein
MLRHAEVAGMTMSQHDDVATIRNGLPGRRTRRRLDSGLTSATI